MTLAGTLARLRALEPADIDRLYAWENDPSVWGVSGTTAPFSRHILTRFLDEQQFDIYRTRQLRLIVECCATDEAVGAVDLFEFEPHHRRAGVGILIHDPAQRGRGLATEALALVADYAREALGLHQLWCEVAADNAASLALFRRAGFVEAGRKRDWLCTPDGFGDVVVMQRLLD